MVSFTDPTIEVLSRPPRYELIMGRLRHAGLRPIRATLRTASSQLGPLMLDEAGAPDEVKELLASPHFAQIAEKRLIIFLGEGDAKLVTPSVLHLQSIDQIASLPARLAIRQRETRRIQEANLRAKTTQSLGEPERRLAQTTGNRVLFLGDCSRKFIEINAALKDRGIETIAALSHVTARDYLASGQFQAIVLHPTQAGDEAALFLTTNGAKTGHMAAHICLLESADFNEALSKMEVSHVDSLIPDSNAAEDIAESLLVTLNRAGSIRQALPAPNQSTGAQSKLYSRRFLEAHVEAQIAEAEELGEPLSLVSITPDNPDLDQAELATKILPHLRETDLVARLSGPTLCISLRATPYRGAVSLARRIEQTCGLPLTWRAVERRRFHTLKTLFSAVEMPPSHSQRKTA